MNDFWHTIPHSSKLGEITEGRHNHIIHNVLYDPNTCVMQSDRNSYILYDEEGTEALIYRPKSIISRMGMRLYSAVVGLFPKGE